MIYTQTSSSCVIKIAATVQYNCCSYSLLSASFPIVLALLSLVYIDEGLAVIEDLDFNIEGRLDADDCLEDNVEGLFKAVDGLP